MGDEPGMLVEGVLQDDLLLVLRVLNVSIR